MLEKFQNLLFQVLKCASHHRHHHPHSGGRMQRCDRNFPRWWACSVLPGASWAGWSGSSSLSWSSRSKLRKQKKANERSGKLRRVLVPQLWRRTPTGWTDHNLDQNYQLFIRDPIRNAKVDTTNKAAKLKKVKVKAKAKVTKSTRRK